MSSIRIKAGLGCALMALCALAQAQSSANQPDPAKFQEHKQRRLAQAKAMEETLASLRSCLEAAGDHTALRECEKKGREEMMRQQKEPKAPTPGNRPG